VTGAVRWFIPALANGVNDAAPLTITGFAEAGRHMVVRLDAWEAHAPNASWQGDFSRLNGNIKTRRASFF